MSSLSLSTMTNERKASKSKASKPKTKRVSKKAYTRSELSRVSAFGAVALCGLGVSLPHLASEVSALTGASGLAGWFLALTIDAGMIFTKCHVSAAGANNRRVSYAVIAACTLLSMILNAHAFVSHAETGFGIVMGVVFGLFLPAFITACSYLASGILARHDS